jgi:26S proteasome regulatory subunit N13
LLTDLFCRAASDPSEQRRLVQNFLNSLKTGGGGSQNTQQGGDKPYPTLPDLLPPSTTIDVVDSADETFLNSLLTFLPPQILLLSQESSSQDEDPSAATTGAALEALSIGQKKEILRKVLRSPQFTQSLGSLTVALRDGGLPSISEALRINVANGGYIKENGGMPLGGGDAVEAFIEGVKRTVQDGDKDDERMDTQ